MPTSTSPESERPRTVCLLLPDASSPSTTRARTVRKPGSRFSSLRFLGLASAMGEVLALATLTFAALVFSVNWLTGGREKKVKR